MGYRTILSQAGSGVSTPETGKLRRGGAEAYRPNKGLSPDRQVGAAILLPAGFRGLETLWGFLAVADDLDRVGGDAVLAQDVLRAMGAAVAEGEGVFGGAALIAVAFESDFEAGKIGEDCVQ